MDDTQTTPTEETVEIATPVTPQDQSAILLSLDELIKSHIASIDKLKEESSKYKQMVEDVFVNDSTYQEHTKIAKEAAKIKSATRQQLMKQPAVEKFAAKAKSLSTELKEKQMALSDYLQEYQRISGSNEIEGYDGEVREIVNTAKLVKRSTNFK